MKNILFVCMGNICRSPTAEAVLRVRLQQHGLDRQITVDSAGTEAYHLGQPPDRRAIDTARRHGIDMSGLRARQVTLHDLTHFDLLLCADQVNLDALDARFGDSGTAERHLLLSYAGIATPRHVPDPYYGQLDGFESVFDLLSDAADALCRRWSQSA